MALSQQQRHEQDEQTLFAMGSIYCAAKHPSASCDSRGVCEDCCAVIQYALGRAGSCPQGHTGNCQDCPHKCYQPEMKEKIKDVMRYAAPRMIYKHPVMTLRYIRKKIR